MNYGLTCIGWAIAFEACSRLFWSLRGYGGNNDSMRLIFARECMVFAVSQARP